MNDGKFEPTTATVGQLLDKWLEAATVSQRPRTLEENRRKIEHRIRPELGQRPLNKLTPALLDTAYRQWLDDGLSPATVHKYHCILSAACRQAVKWGWLGSAPTERATPPRVERKEMVVPTPERLQDLIQAAEARTRCWRPPWRWRRSPGPGEASWWRSGGPTSTSRRER